MSAPTPGVAWELPRARVPDAVAAGLFLVVGLVEVVTRSTGFVGLLVAVGAAAAVGLARGTPAYAVGVAWASGAVQLLSGEAVVFVLLAAAVVVAYSASRYGHPAVVWASGVSIPLAATVALGWLALARGVELPDLGRVRLYAVLPGGGAALATGGWLLVVGVLGVPWVTGLAIRARRQADRSHVQQLAAEEERDRAEVERAAAQEIATLRAEQTRLARDVHDVVGHSLAVILVQAESAGFLPDDDLDRMRLTMSNIATSARRSLQDVRAVLGATGGGGAAPVAAPTVDELVADLREAGNDVRSEVIGDPWPLTTDEQTLVFRLAQEMLTNALKHGVRGAPVFVEQRWRGELLLEVRNALDPAVVPHEGGLGIAGMRRRVEEVGGRLAVRRRESESVDGHGVFTVTAWVPTGGAAA